MRRAPKLHLLTGPSHQAPTYCKNRFAIRATANVFDFRSLWLYYPNKVCMTCVACARALKII